MFNIEVEDNGWIIDLIHRANREWLVVNLSSSFVLKHNLDVVGILRVKANNRDFYGLRNGINQIRCIGKIYAGWAGCPF